MTRITDELITSVGDFALVYIYNVNTRCYPD